MKQIVEAVVAIFIGLIFIYFLVAFFIGLLSIDDNDND